MPRGRCHWALLVDVRNALRERAPEAHAVVAGHRPEYFAGGMAPDALRLFASADKLSSHFYDDQQTETWTRVVQTMNALHPEIANPRRLDGPATAWVLGYLTHILTDVANWRHVVTKLPKFPEGIGIHYGAWIIGDGFALPNDERHLDVAAVRFDAAPPWVQEAPVRQMLARMTERILLPDDTWSIELAYHRNRPEAAGKSDEELLAAQLPQWEACLAAATAAVPADQWRRFRADAVTSAVEAIQEYLDG